MVLRTPVLLLLTGVQALVIAAQTLPNPTPAADAAPAQSILPSATLQPSLDVLKTALGDLRIERWKASSAIRSEAAANVASIQRDLQSTLPALLATADAVPNSPAKVLPVYRNVEALYDVMLRVDAAARLAAPNDQMAEIDQALARLDDNRRTLGDQLQQITETQGTRVIHLEAALKAVPPPPPPPPPPVPVKCPVIPVRKRRPTHVTKPSTPPATQKQPPTSSQ